MKVTDLKENECIHCETEEQANAICKLMHEAGLKWQSKDFYIDNTYYDEYKKETCYYTKHGTYCALEYAKEQNYTIYKAEQFLTQKQEVMSAVVNINQDTSEINITPKEGFEIDLENSYLKNGKVLFKEVKEKYPSKFYYDYERYGATVSLGVSEKYAEKLEILDTLLCLRDEYNIIDGFEEGFRLGEQNWCILPYKCELHVSLYDSVNRIMHFGKEETAELFLKNFEEQLETVKEFL